MDVYAAIKFLISQRRKGKPVNLNGLLSQSFVVVERAPDKFTVPTFNDVIQRVAFSQKKYSPELRSAMNLSSDTFLKKAKIQNNLPLVRLPACIDEVNKILVEYTNSWITTNRLPMPDNFVGILDYPRTGISALSYPLNLKRSNIPKKKIKKPIHLIRKFNFQQQCRQLLTLAVKAVKNGHSIYCSSHDCANDSCNIPPQ
jgi:hypothetical protein